MIDQRRGHERVLYENFMECLNSNGSASQTTLFPVTIELGQDDFLVLKEIKNDLKRIGFDIEYGDDSVITVNGYPSISGSTNIKEVIEILIEEFKSTSNDPSTGVKEKLAAAMASASAIPYGKPLSNIEMETLFDSLFSCSLPNYTPKGKAIVSIITVDELDKRFQ